MNKKEAAKALIEGKVLRIINDTYYKPFRYKFNFDKLIIEDDQGIGWGMGEFGNNTMWEEVREPFKKTIQYVHLGDFTYFKIDTYGMPKGTYNVTIEEIIK
jgi:hypothetical protein